MAQIAATSLRVFQYTEVSHHDLVSISKTFCSILVLSGKLLGSLDEITPTSYLCVAVEGEHGVEGCYAVLRIGDSMVGAPDRAASYPVNAWEYPSRR